MDIQKQVREFLGTLRDWPERPRNSGQGPKTMKVVKAELRALLRDPEIQAGLVIIGTLFVADHEMDAALDELVALAAERAPNAAFCLPAKGLAHFLMANVMANYLYSQRDKKGGDKVIADMSARMRLLHYLGNPAILHPDGKVTITPDMNITGPQALQIRDHMAAQRPEGKRGRKPGAPKPKAGKPLPITDAAIRDTGTMEPEAWGVKHSPDLDLADKKQRRANGARYDRAGARRRRLNPP